MNTHSFHRPLFSEEHLPLVPKMPTEQLLRRLGVEHTNDSGTFSTFDSSPESSESEHEKHWMRVKNALGFGKKD